MSRQEIMLDLLGYKLYNYSFQFITYSLEQNVTIDLVTQIAKYNEMEESYINRENK